MYYTVYCIANIINHRIYIGSHATNNLEDDYMGSGKYIRRAILKYGVDSFEKTTIAIFDNPTDMLNLEKELVSPTFLSFFYTYNLEIGGRGGKLWTQELKTKVSNSLKEGYNKGRKPWNYGSKGRTTISEEGRKIISERMSGSRNPMFGVNVASLLTPEKDLIRRQKISESNRKPKLMKEKYKEVAKRRRWIFNTHTGEISHSYSLETDQRVLSGQWKQGKPKRYKTTLVAEGDF